MWRPTVLTDVKNEILVYIRSEIPVMERHLVGTCDFALMVNSDQNLGLEEEKVAAATLCHDLARLVEPSQIPLELVKRGLDPDLYNHAAPILLHGILSAELARERLGIDAEDVLNAIRRHATGNEEMSLLDKLVYVSDKVEGGRKYSGVEELRMLAARNLTEAYPAVLASVIKYVIAHGYLLDYNSVAAWNSVISEITDRD